MAEKRFLSPDTLAAPFGYSHVVDSPVGRIVYISGQVPLDGDGQLVGEGDFEAQARQVFANLGRALAAAGARPEQVAKITIYVVPHRPEYLPIIEQGRVALFGDHKPADTLVGVETLSQPDYLIEVDAVAVIDS